MNLNKYDGQGFPYTPEEAAERAYAFFGQRFVAPGYKRGIDEKTELPPCRGHYQALQRRLQYRQARSPRPTRCTQMIAFLERVAAWWDARNDSEKTSIVATTIIGLTVLTLFVVLA